MKSISITSILLLLGFFLAAQPFPNAKHIISSGADNPYSISNALVRDGNGNIIMAGYFNGTADFGGASFTSKGFLGLSTDDGFIAKYDPSGNLLWAKQFRSNLRGGISDIALDDQDNIYFAGSGRNGLSIDGVSIIDTTTSGLAWGKITSNGTLDWTKAATGKVRPALPGLIDLARNLEVGPNGELYTWGSFEGDIDFAGQMFTHPNNVVSYFIARFDIDGSFKWFTPVGDRANVITGLDVDASGAPFITGGLSTAFPAVFDSITITARHWGDPYIAKFDQTSGSILWLKSSVATTMGTFESSRPTDIHIHKGTGDIYLTGSFGRDTLDFGNGKIIYNRTNPGRDFYLAKFDSNGVPQWAQDGRPGATSNGVFYGQGLYLDSDTQGNLFVLGSVGVTTGGGYSMIIGSGASAVTLGPAADADMFVAKFRDNGNLDWAKFIFGKDDDFAGGIVATDNNTAFIACAFQDSVFLEDTILTSTPTTISTNTYITECDGRGTTSIKDIRASSPIILYPQPASDQVSIKTDDVSHGAIRIYNFQGQLVQANSFNQKDPAIDIRLLSPAVYSIEIIAKHTISRSKLLIQR